jgi:hypothetical protein
MRLLAIDDFAFLFGEPDLITDPRFPRFASTLRQTVALLPGCRVSASPAIGVADQRPAVMDFRRLNQYITLLCFFPADGGPSKHENQEQKPFLLR